MLKNIVISGFADEISPMLDEQLKVVKELGMEYISLRSADGKSIAQFTEEEVENDLLPRLKAAGVGVSSIGSPAGKVGVEDEAGFAEHCEGLERLCRIAKILDCRYIRMFSFYIPEGKDPAVYRDVVMEKLAKFAAIAKKHDVVLLHENEKEIFGDTGARCRDILDTVGCGHFKAAFDFANFVQCGEDPAACWELLKKDVVYIHIKDAVHGNNENVLCGTGDGKIEPLLKQAIREEGYEGFLTLEPHLVLFDALKNLETADAAEVIKVNKYKNGAEGYAAQYHALVEILDRI